MPVFLPQMMNRIIRPVTRRFTTARAPPPPGAFNVDQAEVRHFNELSADWWNPTGTAQFLHTMNPLRLQFLRALIGSDLAANRPGSHASDASLASARSDLRWLRGWRVLDVGCGAGILSEVRDALISIYVIVRVFLILRLCETFFVGTLISSFFDF